MENPINPVKTVGSQNLWHVLVIIGGGGIFRTAQKLFSPDDNWLIKKVRHILIFQDEIL